MAKQPPINRNAAKANAQWAEIQKAESATLDRMLSGKASVSDYKALAGVIGKYSKLAQAIFEKATEQADSAAQARIAAIDAARALREKPPLTEEQTEALLTIALERELGKQSVDLLDGMQSIVNESANETIDTLGGYLDDHFDSFSNDHGRREDNFRQMLSDLMPPGSPEKPLTRADLDAALDANRDLDALTWRERSKDLLDSIAALLGNHAGRKDSGGLRDLLDTDTDSSETRIMRGVAAKQEAFDTSIMRMLNDSNTRDRSDRQAESWWRRFGDFFGRDKRGKGGDDSGSLLMQLGAAAGLAYAISPEVRKWVDDQIGVIRNWLDSKFGSISDLFDADHIAQIVSNAWTVVSKTASDFAQDLTQTVSSWWDKNVANPIEDKAQAKLRQIVPPGSGLVRGTPTAPIGPAPTGDVPPDSTYAFTPSKAQTDAAWARVKALTGRDVVSEANSFPNTVNHTAKLAAYSTEIGSDNRNMLFSYNMQNQVSGGAVTVNLPATVRSTIGAPKMGKSIMMKPEVPQSQIKSDLRDHAGANASSSFSTAGFGFSPSVGPELTLANMVGH